MPFSQTTTEHTEEYWTDHFNKFLKPIIEENLEIEAHRSEPMRGDILRNIIFNLVQAPIVVADLTDNNPNVYWELGVRQSFKHCTVTIAEEGMRLPFDVSVKGTLLYLPKNHTKMEEFRKNFKNAIDDCLRRPDVSDSHVLESMSGRGSLFEVFRRDETVRRLDALLDELNFDLDQLTDIFEIAKENLNGGKDYERIYRVTRCQTNSLVLLLSNRYLDQEKTFYDKIQKYLSRLNVINGQLGIWEFQKEDVERFLLKNKDADLSQSNELIDFITQIRSNLINQV
jgi:hypothetical protein